MPRPTPLQVFRAEYSAKQRGLTACGVCLQVRKPDGYKWCPACRAEHKQERKARYNLNRQLARKAQREEEQRQRLADLAEADKGPCPRCKRPKPLYDNYALCALCRQYYRERMASQRQRTPLVCESCGTEYTRRGLHKRAMAAPLCPRCYSQAKERGQLTKEV